MKFSHIVAVQMLLANNLVTHRTSAFCPPWHHSRRPLVQRYTPKPETVATGIFLKAHVRASPARAARHIAFLSTTKGGGNDAGDKVVPPDAAGAGGDDSVAGIAKDTDKMTAEDKLNGKTFYFDAADDRPSLWEGHKEIKCADDIWEL